MWRWAVRVGLCAVWLAACAGPAATPTATAPPIPSATVAATDTPAAPTPTSTASGTPTLAASSTASASATLTPIPGFEGWEVFQAPAVDIAVEDGALVLTLRRRALWFNSERGVLVYQPVTGNFKLTAQVTATRNSSPDRTPGGDGSVQLGGLMARSGEPGRENYVFIVVGNDGGGLAVETKSTVDGVSIWEGPSWPSAAAELRLCRVGATFFLYKRPVETAGAWEMAQTVDRADLPETLQVGANIYTDSQPDLRVRFDDLRVETVETEAGCTSD